jgi:hypothetical protein
MQPSENRVWFPAKKHGWGWGLPCSWQGWVVFAVWLALLCGGAVVLGPKHLGLYVAYAVVLGIALFIICLIKGEKPRWRWGKD